MTPNKITTPTLDDSDEKPFDFSPARGPMLLDEAGQNSLVQASSASALVASPDSGIVSSEPTTAFAALGSTATPVSSVVESPAPVPLTSAAEPAFDSGGGLLAQADTSLIHLDQFRADPRFSGIDGHGVSVVVLDTGIDLNHTYFGPDANHNGVSDRIVYSYSFVGNNSSDASDHNNHGSNVAGIIGSQDGTYTGMAPGVNIIALKVLSDVGQVALRTSRKP
jgi:subtilisin family serine protease